MPSQVPILPNRPVLALGSALGLTFAIWDGNFALPDGLVLDAATGTISGTPSRTCPQTVVTVIARSPVLMEQQAEQATRASGLEEKESPERDQPLFTFDIPVVVQAPKNSSANSLQLLDELRHSRNKFHRLHRAYVDSVHGVQTVPQLLSRSLELQGSLSDLTTGAGESANRVDELNSGIRALVDRTKGIPEAEASAIRDEVVQTAETREAFVTQEYFPQILNSLATLREKLEAAAGLRSEMTALLNSFGSTSNLSPALAAPPPPPTEALQPKLLMQWAEQQRTQVEQVQGQTDAARKDLVSALKKSVDLHDMELTSSEASDIPDFVALEQEIDERTQALWEIASREAEASSEALGALAESKGDFTPTAAAELQRAVAELDGFLEAVRMTSDELDQISESTKAHREKRDEVRKVLGGTSDPQADMRLQLAIKKLQNRLKEIDDEIKLGDKTEEDKIALQKELEEKQGGDKTRRRALREVAALIAQGFPELEVEFPAAVSLERWAHLPAREFGEWRVFALLIKLVKCQCSDVASLFR